jgi:hypothetical protein
VADWLTHVLIAYTVVELAGYHWEWIDDGYVTVGMAGALIPDVSKAYLVLGERGIESSLGVPFEWYGLHTVGGLVVLALAATLWFAGGVRRRVFGLLLLGGGTHLVLDSFIKEPTGHSYAALWPLTYHRVPSLGLYISTDVWPVLVAGLLAVAVRYVTPGDR